MKCNACTRTSRPVNGSPAVGYCDACGWFIGAEGEAHRPARAQVIVGSYLMALAANSYTEDPMQVVRNVDAAEPRSKR